MRDRTSPLPTSTAGTVPVAFGLSAIITSSASTAPSNRDGTSPSKGHIVWAGTSGGLDKEGHPADTRTEAQRTALIRLVKALQLVFPNAKQVIGHRDTSPDLNGDGIISPNEYMKACPCFDVKKEF